MRLPVLTSFLALGVLLPACSGGSGGGGSDAFQVVSVSVTNGEIWEINRAIEISFNAPVAVSSVDFTTFQIKTMAGQPAVGTLRLKTGDPTTVVFRPKCPRKDDFSDAGLLPNGTTYTLTVVGTDTGRGSFVSSAGRIPLRRTQVRTFTTPFSLNPDVFQDLKPGPPAPVVRLVGSGVTEASYVEVGGDTNRRVYFAFDPFVPEYTLEVDPATDPGFDPLTEGIPLNLYSDARSQIAVVLEFDQPINPVSTNVNNSRLALEFRDGIGSWAPLDTRVILDANCTETGARVRLEPVGILPEGGQIRAVVRPGFQDVAGNGTLNELNTFGVLSTNQSNFVSLTPPEGKADEFLEEFVLSGDEPGSYEDTDAIFSTARAVWGDDKVQAGFTFEGTGGPSGTFDVVVDSGETLIFNTIQTEVDGGPGGVRTTTQVAVGGVLDVRNLIVRNNGLLTLTGPNAFRLNATGYVRIEGTIDGSGQDAPDVNTLGTGNIPQIGGRGELGGGDGGRASTVTNSSTPRGERGHGPFGEDSTSGGQGGESGYAPGEVDNRRPGGGGGGALSTDLPPTGGQDGNQRTTGAEGGDPDNNESWAQGGHAGDPIFRDGNSGNDFFGVKVQLDVMGNEVLTPGELAGLTAGSGGGGGGDAIPGRNFPSNNWNPCSDEKGAGGGGGGGALVFRALGPIIFGKNGSVLSRGGLGASGENTNFNDHIGGSSGGGSGGMVVLESASFIDFTDGAANKGNSRYVDMTGKNGGPSATVSGKQVTGGGKGGGGLFQIHVPEPLKPPANWTDPANPPDTNIFAPGNFSAPNPKILVPTFGARSLARSRWISIGAAAQDPAGGFKPLDFRFAGVDATGAVETTNGIVDELPFLLDGAVANPGASVVGTNQLVLTGAELDPLTMTTPENDIYLRTPTLMRRFTLRIYSLGPGPQRDFSISSASYEDSSATLTITAADSTAGTLKDFVEGIGELNAGYRVVPRFFRIVRNGAQDSLPDSALVRFEFQATGKNALGQPDESNILVDWTGNIDDFDLVPPGDLSFFRFRVEFDLDTGRNGLTVQTRPVEVDFLRIPFAF